MKQSAFIIILFIIAFIAALFIYLYVFGNPANFKDGEGLSVPSNLLGQIYTGGPLVSLLITLSIMDFAIIIERSLSLRKASGRRSVSKFFKDILDSIRNDKIENSIALCDAQKGSVANIIRAGISRYIELRGDKKSGDTEKQLVEVQRSVEEAMMVIGMIRAFAALARAGAPDAIQLATGISEALINTAGGLFVAILGIVAYNFFVNKVDNFTYQVDEASYNVMQILKTK
jgi:biopolymer transport protein ExbB